MRIFSAQTKQKRHIKIRQYLLKHLPDYMVPAYFILESIPLPNGKVDEQASRAKNIPAILRS